MFTRITFGTLLFRGGSFCRTASGIRWTEHMPQGAQVPEIDATPEALDRFLDRAGA